MEKTTPRTEASFIQDDGSQQKPANQNTPLHTDIPPHLKKREIQFSFVVRISQKERLLINKLSDDFGENIVTIFSKSLRLYRAIAEAADQGGSLVMTTRKSAFTPARERDPHGLSILDEKAIQTQKQLKKPTDTGLDVLVSPADNSDNIAGDGRLALIAQAAASYAGDESALSSGGYFNVNEAIIAVRDQFADNGLTPIRLNPLYIVAAKGLKSERISLNIDVSFADRLQSLEKKTGLTKSSIVRDSIRLYDFVKRNFQEPGAKFFIGEIPILAI